MSNPRKRSIRIHGHITSISLEDEFWEALLELAERKGTTTARLVEQIDDERGDQNLASAVRVWLFMGVNREFKRMNKAAERSMRAHA